MEILPILLAVAAVALVVGALLYERRHPPPPHSGWDRISTEQKFVAVVIGLLLLAGIASTCNAR